MWQEQAELYIYKLIDAIEDELPSRIQFKLDTDSLRGTGTACTYTREVRREYSWPESGQSYELEHLICIDPELNGQDRLRRIIHEVAHVWLHVGRCPERFLERVDDRNIVPYSASENRAAAALVELCLLNNQPFAGETTSE